MASIKKAIETLPLVDEGKLSAEVITSPRSYGGIPVHHSSHPPHGDARWIRLRQHPQYWAVLNDDNFRIKFANLIEKFNPVETLVESMPCHCWPYRGMTGSCTCNDEKVVCVQFCMASEALAAAAELNNSEIRMSGRQRSELASDHLRRETAAALDFLDAKQDAFDRHSA